MAEDLQKRYTIDVDVMIDKDVYVKDQEAVNTYFFQGDTKSAILIINLKENGKVLNLDNRTVKVGFKKVDGTNVMQDSTTGVTILDAPNGKVQVELRTQALAARGKVRGQLSISESSGLVTETSEFFFVVRESILNGAVKSSNDLPLIENAISAGAKLDATTVSNVLAVTTDVQTLKTDTSKKIDMLEKRKNDLLRANKRKISKWNYPAWFTWKDAPITILSDGTNFFTPFDVAVFKNVGGKNLYVDPVNGSDTNDGLGWITAVKSVQKAYTLAANNDTIICKSGVYKRAHVVTAGTNIEKNINIITDGGTVRWYQADDHTYTKTAGATNVYQTARTNVTHVIDIQLLPINGESIALTKVNSIAECDALEGSYYNDGTNTYIHMFGNIAPNNNNAVILLQTGNPGLSVTNATQNVNLYVEGIEFYGGTANISIANSATYLTPNLYMKNCKLRYASTKNALNVLGGQYIFSQKCEASFSPLDGFNYHAQNGQVVKSIEVDCLGRGNGDNTLSTNNNNGSTTHDGSKAIRINCTYYENMGVNCCDVTQDTMSINLGVSAFNSKSQATDTTNGNFSAQQAGTTMYLEGCISFGSTWGIVPVTNTTMYLKNCLYDTKNGAGTLTILS